MQLHIDTNDTVHKKSTVNCYSAYGLRVCSNVELPMLRSTEAGISDLNIQCDILAQPMDIGALGDHAIIKFDRDEAILELGHFGVIKVSKGRDAVLVCQPDVKIELIQAYIIGAVLGILLYQRGYLVLHASTVEFNGKAIAFAGYSGVGKSSIAAALCARGGNIVADDLTVVELNHERAMVIPAYPRLKIDSKVAELFNYEPQRLIPLAIEEGDKFGCMMEDRFKDTQLPLSAVYMIGENEEPARIKSCRPMESLIKLIAYSFPTMLYQQGDEKHLKQLHDLVSVVSIHQLLRPRVLSALPLLSEKIHSHIMGLEFGKRQ